MHTTIDMAKASDGRLSGEIDIMAYGWETRYSWGHTAEVMVNFRTVVKAKYRYCNRTWEGYRFQSVIHGVLRGYVHYALGIDPMRSICKRDQTPMKSAEAESRRLARLEAYAFAATLYRRLMGLVDGKLTYEDIAKETATAKVA